MTMEIKVVPRDFEQASADLASVKATLDERRRLLESAYSQTRAGWNGKASNAFDDYAARVISSYDELEGKMEELRGDIEQTGAAMQGLDQELADSLNDA